VHRRPRTSEESNTYGRRTRQAANWTAPFCKAIIKGILNEYKAQFNQVAFAAEEVEEMRDQEHGKTFDAVYGEEDLGAGLPSGRTAQEADIVRQEEMDSQEREADPDYEKMRKQESNKLTEDEIG
jgi:hypothetical protein